MAQQFPNLRHLQICLAVAKFGSISGASSKVHLSQPAISQAIAKLEGDIGTKLFARHSGGMFVTSTGRDYLARAERAMELIRQGAVLSLKTSAANGTSAKNADFHRFFTATQLRALIALSRSNNFTTAAQDSKVSQPSLHRAARELEKLSDMRLFEAHQRGVRLTKAAEILVQHAMLAASELRHGLGEIQHSTNARPQRLFIGSLPLARSKILPAAIDELVSANKNLQVQIIEGPYDEQLKKLRQGDIEFIIGALRQKEIGQDIVQETLFTDRLAVVARQTHPLTGRHGLSLGELTEFDWIAPPQDTPTGRYLFDKLGIADLQSTPVKVVSSSLRLIRSLLLSGDYITIISTHQIERELAQGILAKINIDMSGSEREIGLSYRKSWQPTPLHNRFLDIIRRIAGGAEAG